MRLLVTANVAPFLGGGAEYHIRGLVAALRSHGHQVACLRLPFRFSPPEAVVRLMTFCDGYDLNVPNGVRVDRTISLQFPGYGMAHEDHVVWLMHQHRAAYELFEPSAAGAEERALRERIQAFDDRALGRVVQRFANSRRVAERLQRFNRLEAEPLYHPPHAPERFRSRPADDYVFYPSRLESLKRQDLLIEAARRTRSPVGFLLAGDGGQAARYRRMIDQYGLGDRVRLLGHISEAEKRAFYARSLAVFFGPHDEDYGYVSLEAMLSAKPVITCSDSGGPLELVEDGRTGLVVPPEPDAVARAVDGLHAGRRSAAAMGVAGRHRYDALGIGWERVVARLLA